MTILIIGSKGFIGEHCFNYFVKLGHIVFGCDVINNINDENYFLINNTKPDFKQIFAENNFDVCVNCSGAANVSASIANPIHDFNLNTVNVFNILDAIRLYQKECKFVNLSSAAVYGNPQYLPIDETHKVNPISPYGFHKLMAENICNEFNVLYGLKTCNLRIFSAYGPGLKKQLFWDTYNKVKTSKNNTVRFFGNGKETRDFIYIGDLVRVIEFVINKGRFNGERINVANGIEVSISEAVKTCINLINQEISIAFSGELKKGDPLNWKADISKISKMGYKPFFNLNDGLKNYVKWLRETE